jgi:hypothetical protein
MGCDAGFYDIFAGILPSGHGAVRIGFHERRIAGHVGGQYRRKPFVNLPLRHVLPFGRSIAGLEPGRVCGLGQAYGASAGEGDC